MNTSYVKYLDSCHWRNFKKEYKKHNPYFCICCNHSPNHSLHLHHLNYDNIGKEKFTDVVYLCEKCHNILHKIIKNFKIKTSDIPKYEIKTLVSNYTPLSKRKKKKLKKLRKLKKLL